MFQIQNLKYKNILDIPDMLIESGKTTCIIGESGSGKTTLLRLLNKMISPSKGEILYNSIPLSKTDSIKHRRNVVMLSQSPVIFEGNIKDNLQIGLKFSEKPLANDTELISAMKIAQLDKPLEFNAEQLSGGEKQRLALARILLLNPDILLLDEPSSALDENTADLITKALVEYSQENNKTLIMVTHSISIAKKYSDKIFKLYQGKLIQEVE